ncbi:hypothetical protein [Polluticoccus soli]|uniref:hypothetical protein n=1 Tax=Polluticoccus soli TaxID=3034150 RepID=UPI0023E20F81|nr:hypothetical protein [Flavipsychrobacter sp. JY13-12]
MRTLFLLMLAASAGFVSCSESKTTSGGSGAIVLGDSSMMVTETDSQYLGDRVMDMRPAKAAEPTEEAEVVKTDTAQKPATVEEPVESKTARVEEKPAEAPTGKGLKIDMKDVTLFIPGVEAKGSGTSYSLRNGSLNGKEIRVSGGKVDKISQRYQTVVVAKNNLGTLVLDNLSTTTGWEALRSAGNSYTITGLNENRLAAPRVSPSSIRNAVSREARSSRATRKNEQKWLAAVKNVRSANQKPLSVELRSVMWKIDGKDARGKSFSKQVRVDMPL